jgi:hypothetical protein
MRASLILMITLLAGCATDRELATAPPAGVDLSGHWRLNVADSDDPLRLTQALAAGAGPSSADQRSGGRQRSGRGGQSTAQLPPLQPISIPATIVADMLRWPGTQVELRQVGGVVTFISDGDTRAYTPGTAAGRAAKSNHRSSAPPPCGWEGASLVVHFEREDNQPGYDANYRLSDDGTRLLQIITMQGGRLTGFTMSRVWDRE